MLRHMAVVTKDVSEKRSAYIIRVTRIDELGTALALATMYIVILRSVRWLLVTANVVPSLPILVTLMMKAILSSEMSVPIRATRRNVPENGIVHSHRRENLKSSIAFIGQAL
jgi:hypothetical protein